MARQSTTASREYSSSLAAKFAGVGSIKSTTVEDSEILSGKFDFTDTKIPSMNIAYSADIDGGIPSGITVIAGPSKHFKSLLMLLSMKAYLDRYPEAIGFLYDCEFGASKKYFKSVGIDPARVIHKPFLDLEELTFDLTQVVNKIDRGDKVFIALDSLGNTASKKEAEDALNEKSAQDMTRAKKIKSLFRIITPHVTIKNFPMVIVNHIYMEQGAMYPKAIVSGGTGPYLSADAIWIISRSQEKEGTELNGWKFTINIEKSRLVEEKAKIPIVVSFDRGIDRLSGIFELAESFGYVKQVSKGWYSVVNLDTGEWSENKQRKSELRPYLAALVKNDTFKEQVKNFYSLEGKSLVHDGEEDFAVPEIDEEDEGDIG